VPLTLNGHLHAHQFDLLISARCSNLRQGSRATLLIAASQDHRRSQLCHMFRPALRFLYMLYYFINLSDIWQLISLGFM